VQPPPADESIAFKTAERIRVLTLRGVGCVLSLALACYWSPYTDVEQPIAFPHKVHVAEEEIPCIDCHEGAEEAEHATIPVGELCMDCHEEPNGAGLEEAKLVAMLAEGEPLRWKRVHKLAEHVRFSHRRHVMAGHVLCETCHGEVTQREVPFSEPFISFNQELGMERCIACHMESGNPRASVDCALCHR
jgi:hypothetical protein